MSAESFSDLATQPRLYHGGVAGLRQGDLIEPGHAASRYVAGCPTCEAHAAGEHRELDPRTPDGRVYCTTDREYARYYASRAVRGWLYSVTPTGPLHEAAEGDLGPTWWSEHPLRVRGVIDRAVRLTDRQRRRLFVRWGGSEREWAALLSEVGRG
jgi:hypothetical protein